MDVGSMVLVELSPACEISVFIDEYTIIHIFRLYDRMIGYITPESPSVEGNFLCNYS
jgi:hypothetical protein